MSQDKNRHYCFTINNATFTQFIELEHVLKQTPHVTYCIWQHECGENGTQHIQGYMELSQPSRITNLKEWYPTAHFECRRGTRDQARDYCRKRETRINGPKEFGIWKENGQGRREDIQAILKLIDNGKSELDIATAHPTDWVRYHRAFERYRILIKPIQRNWKTNTTVIIGEPGSGKSKYCQEKAPTAYWKQRGNWWDGYQGQEEVVIDDYYGWLPYDTLLRLLDRYPMIVETKGSSTQFLAKTLFITSNKPIEKWYSKQDIDIRALTRRVDQIIHQ